MNPFVFGKIVRGSNFCDRESERSTLISSLKSGVSVSLLSPRRFGKSSLIFNAFEGEKDLKFVYMDVMGVTSLSEFVSMYANAVARSSFNSIQSIGSKLKKLFSNVDRVSLEVDLKLFRLNLELRPGNSRGLEDVLSLSERLDGRFVIAMDEFQDLTDVTDTEDLMLNLRKSFQQFKKTSFLFSGSRRHAMKGIFSESDKPFYRFARMMTLGNLPPDRVSEFVKEKFSSTGVTITDEQVRKLFEISKGHPYYSQSVPHYLWEIANEKGHVEDADIGNAVKAAMASEVYVFQTRWDGMTPNQRKVVKNLAGGRMPYDTKMNSSSVKRVVDFLIQEDVIERKGGYGFVDPLFEIWLKDLPG